MKVEFLKNMMTVGTGVSSMRWVFVWTWLIVVIVPMFSWAYKYIQNPTVDMPGNVVAFATIVASVVTAGKVGQSFTEKKNGGTDATPVVKP